MATFLTSSSPLAALPHISKVRTTNCHFNTLRTIGGPMIGGVRFVPKIQITKEAKRSSTLPSCLKNTISCSIAQPETLQSVQGIISKQLSQLSIDESTVTPQTKFADLGADSLDIVEIMMALEEKFEVAIGEGGAENISTVQDSADLVEKVKAASSA